MLSPETVKNKHVLVVGNIRQPHKTLEELGFTMSWFYMKSPHLRHLESYHARCKRVFIYSDETIDDLVAMAKTVHAIEKIDFVVAFHDASQLDALTIATALGLPFSLTYEGIVNSRYKDKTRDLLREHKLCQIASSIVNNVDEMKTFLAQQTHCDKFISKPIAGTASEDVHLLERADFDQLDFDQFSYPLLVEEFIEGREFSVEAFMDDGQCHVLAITEKFKDPKTFIETGHLVPARLTDNEQQRIVDFVSQALPVLGIHSGMTHSEVILNDDAVEMIETHTRVGGDSIADLVRLATGIELHRIQAKQSLLLPVEKEELVPSVSGKHACIRFKLSEPSDKPIVEIRGVAEAKLLPGVETLSVAHEVGQLIPVLNNSFDRAASVIVAGESADEVLRTAESAMNTLEFALE